MEWRSKSYPLQREHVVGVTEPLLVLLVRSPAGFNIDYSICCSRYVQTVLVLYCTHGTLPRSRVTFSQSTGVMMSRYSFTNLYGTAVMFRISQDTTVIVLREVAMCASCVFILIPLFSWPQAGLAAVLGAHNVMNVSKQQQQQQHRDAGVQMEYDK